MPTARKAISLTTDSKAIAATMPSWRSRLSRWRVPKTIVKPASASATIQRTVLPPGPGDRRRAARRLSQQLVSAVDRLQLQRDIRHDADHGDRRHQAGQQRALAITAGDEIGDRRDAVGARDADHLADHQPGQQHRQHRAEVDRQKPDAARSGTADTAEIGPRGAVDGDRQRIDPGVADHRALLRRRAGRPTRRRRTAAAGTRTRRRAPATATTSSIAVVCSINQARTAMNSAQTINSAAGNKGTPASASSRSHKASSGKLNSSSARANRPTSAGATSCCAWCAPCSQSLAPADAPASRPMQPARRLIHRPCSWTRNREHAD